MDEKRIRQSKATGVFWGSILILFGLIFLLDNLEILDVDDIFSTFWPVILILIGFKLILNARQSSALKESESSATNAQSQISENSPMQFSKVFGDVQVKFNARDFNGGRISTVFGDLNVDLSEAHIKSGERVLILNGMFGDITVSVPKNLPVAIRANLVAGDVKIFDEKSEGLFIKKMYQSENYETAKNKLHISASQVFGDIRFW